MLRQNVSIVYLCLFFNQFLIFNCDVRALANYSAAVLQANAPGRRHRNTFLHSPIHRPKSQGKVSKKCFGGEFCSLRAAKVKRASRMASVFLEALP